MPFVDRLGGVQTIERVLVDLDVNEVGLLGVGRVQLLDGLQLGRARGACAQGGRRKQDDQRSVGRLQRGFIQVTDVIAGDGVGFEFSNCDVERDKSDTTTNRNDTIKICRGANVRFRAIGSKYQILIRGSGIYLSAVGHGFAVLNGAGDDPSVDSDGTYSLNDLPYRSLPDFATTLTLAAPSVG